MTPFWRNNHWCIPQSRGRFHGYKLMDHRPWYGRFKFINNRNVKQETIQIYPESALMIKEKN